MMLDDPEPPNLAGPSSFQLRPASRNCIARSRLRFGWDDEYLYSFQIGRQKIGARD